MHRVNWPVCTFSNVGSYSNYQKVKIMNVASLAQKTILKIRL